MRLVFKAVLLMSLLWSSNAFAALTTEQKQADIDAIVAEWMPQNRSLDPEEMEAFNAALADLRASVATSTDAEHGLRIQRLVATTNNAHTQAVFGPLGSVIHRLPIRVWWFEEGLFITKAHPDFAHLVGAQILSFGDLTVEQAYEGAVGFVPGVAPWERYRSISPLTQLEALHLIGASPSPDSVDVGVLYPDGRRDVATLGPEPAPDPDDDWPTWAISLVPSAEGWPHVLAATGTQPPYLQEPGENIYLPMAEEDAVYIRFNRIYGTDETLMDETINYLFALHDDRPQNLIVDFRYNHGGDLLRMQTFLNGVYGLLPADGHVYVLGGRATMSAAIVSLVTLYADGDDRVTFIGEPLGDALRFWSEGGGVELPGSGMIVFYNDGFHNWADGCGPQDDCFWPAVVYGRAVGDLVPDVTVPMNFETYVAGRDQVLDRVWQLEAARRQ